MARRFTSSSERARLLLWIVATLVAHLVLGAGAGAGEEPTSEAELQLQLARKEQFYLELVPGQRRLSLHLAGVALRTYPLFAVEAGVPQIAFVDRADASHLSSSLFPAARLEPPRPEMRLEILPPPAQADSTTPPLQLPPRFDEMPVPWTYRLHYGEELTLVVTSLRPAEQRGPAAVFGTLRDKLADVKHAFQARRPVLRLTLARADAEHLYRSLPPDTALLVLGN